MTPTPPQPAIRTMGIDQVLRERPKCSAGIDLEIARGSVFALLGPDEAGKTTTIRILATADPAQRRNRVRRGS